MELCAPVRQEDRIASMDVVRGFALLGILLLNIVSFGLPFAAYMNPTIYGEHTAVDRTVWVIAQTLFDGKFRCLFSLLFGAGTVLLLERAERRGAGIAAADIYYRRTMWLILFGLLHAHLIWYGDILYSYGVVGLLLFPLRNLSAKALLIAGGVLMLIHSLNGAGAGIGIGELQTKAREAAAAPAPDAAQRKALTEWKAVEEMFAPSAEEVEREVQIHRSGWLANLPLRSANAVVLEFTMFFQFFFLDVLSMLVLGMGLAKAGVFDGSRSAGFYLVMALVGFVIGVPLNYWATRAWEASGFAIPEYFLYIGSTADLGRLAVCLGYAGLCVLAVKRGWRILVFPFAAVGRTALSNYLLTSILCTWFFNGYGFGYFGKLSRADLYWVVLAVWTINLTLSPLWLRAFHYGPAEWIWRSLTHWEKQPFRRSRDTEAIPAPA